MDGIKDTNSYTLGNFRCFNEWVCAPGREIERGIVLKSNLHAMPLIYGEPVEKIHKSEYTSDVWKTEHQGTIFRILAAEGLGGEIYIELPDGKTPWNSGKSFDDVILSFMKQHAQKLLEHVAKKKRPEAH